MTNVPMMAMSRDNEQLPSPSNIEAEQALLGAMIFHNEVTVIIAEYLRPEHFFEELHGRIYSCICDMLNAGKPATPITIKAILGDVNLGGVSLQQYLARLAANATTIVNAPAYAMSIHDMAMRREIISVISEIDMRARDSGVDDTALKQIESAEASLGAIRANSSLLNNTTRFEAHIGAERMMDRIREIKAGTFKRGVVSTGVEDIDRATGGGFEGGNLWIVAGRPGMGKTVTGLSLARQTAKRGTGVLFFEFEIDEAQTMARLMADMSYMPHSPLTFGDIMRGNIEGDANFFRLENAMRELERMPLTIDVASRLTVAQIHGRIRLEKAKMAKEGHSLRVVFMDYLKQIQATDRYRGNRTYEVGEISAGLKQIAKDEDVCMVLLAQLNRQVENREDKRPNLADLRESGDLEADADVVAFLYRHEVYLGRSPDVKAGKPEAQAELEMYRNQLEMILGKNRAGPTNTLKLWCDVSTSSIAGSHGR